VDEFYKVDETDSRNYIRQEREFPKLCVTAYNPLTGE